MTTSDELAVELRKLFVDRFSLDDMIDLAFNLDPRAGDLGQTTKNGMARELALYIVRRDWVARLVKEVGPQERPDIDWKSALPGFASASLLSDDDRRKLIEVLAHTYDMVLGPAARFSLLQKSGAGDRAWHIDLAGAAIEVAEKIVADLEPLGILPSKPGYHALGALSDYIRLLSDTTQDDGRVLAELIVKYQLITDRDYLDKLTASFNLNVGTVRQVDPALLPPSIKDNESLVKQALKVDREIEQNNNDAESIAGVINSSQTGGRIDTPAGRAAGTGFLTDDDRRKLIETLANNYEMQMGPEARLGLLQRAGLGHHADHIGLVGEPIDLAHRIVAHLEPLGILPGEPGYQALGALIDSIRQQPDTYLDDGLILAELLVKYQLIVDPDYMDQLQASFVPSVTAVREVDPTLRRSYMTKKELLKQRAAKAEEDFNQRYLDADLFAGALYSAQAVGRIERPAARALGTGFLIGPDLILATNSVFRSKEMLSEAVIRFDYQANTDGVVTQGRVFEFSPDFYVGSPPEELDFALVRLKGEPLAERKLQPGDEGLDYLEMLRRGRHRGYLLVSPQMILRGEQVAVIQHPLGRPQKIVMTSFILDDMSAERVRQTNVTEPGSAGAPLFNRRWEVIALHHSGGAHPPIKDPALAKELMLRGIYKFSEGIPMRAILPLIEQYLPRQ